MSESAGAQRVAKRSLMIAGHGTSVSLEEIFWTELKTAAEANGVSLATLVAKIDAARSANVNLSSALRVFVVETLREKRADGAQKDAVGNANAS